MEQYDAEELMQYIQERKFRLLRARLSEMNEADIAEFLGELEDNPKVMVFRIDRKSTRLNSSHVKRSRMPSSA